MTNNRDFTTPVAIFIFNRPSTTIQVFEKIKQIKPRNLIIIADGPRNLEDIPLCQECKAIVENIDWDCNIEKIYSEINMGVVKRYTSALDEIFSVRDTAIIFDDDCKPELSFFYFCEEMLEKYAGMNNVMLVTGQTMTNPDINPRFSYFFSKYALIWGWATWKRAWQMFHLGMNLWPYLRETNWLSNIIKNPTLKEYWRKSFDRAYAGGAKTWDYQWMYVFFLLGGLSIVPTKNQISNIGFGPDSVNTKDNDSPNANLITFPIEFPLVHPDTIEVNDEADSEIEEKLWLSRYRENNYVVRDGKRIFK